MPFAASAQFSRDARVQHVTDVAQGDVWAGVGIGHVSNRHTPLSGLTGDLTSFGVIHVGYGLGDRVLLELHGAAFQRLAIDRSDPAPVTLDPGTADGVTSDAGDFELALSLAPLGRRLGWSAGGHLRVKLPNSDEMKGIGPNTTDVTLAALVSHGAPRWRATGWVGVAIMEAPLQNFVQNDVFTYAFRATWEADPRLTLSASLRGHASTRSTVPIGTEDLGEARLGAQWHAGPTRLDVGIGRGYAQTGGEWTFGAGVSHRLAGAPRR